MRIRIFIDVDADPDAEPGYQNDPDPDADPQHCLSLVCAHCVQPCLSPAACAHSRAMCATHSGPCGR